MQSYPVLVSIFFKQMIRSKALWVISSILLIMILLIFYYESNMADWLGNGMTFDMATQKASNQLRSLSVQIINNSLLFVLIVSAMVAPGSRKNGTTQFLLSMQIARKMVALAQFSALLIFIFIAAVIIHVGFGIAAIKVGLIGLPELFLSWIPFCAVLFTTAAVSFSLSMAFSSVIAYLILLGIPKILLPLIQQFLVWKGEWFAVPVARLFDNIGFLFPDPAMIIFWPFLSSRLITASPPYPEWSWCILNYCFSVLFWVFWGYYLYRSHNIGSRQVLS